MINQTIIRNYWTRMVYIHGIVFSFLAVFFKKMLIRTLCFAKKIAKIPIPK